jgi:hypothetical protein
MYGITLGEKIFILFLLLPAVLLSPGFRYLYANHLKTFLHLVASCDPSLINPVRYLLLDAFPSVDLDL